MGEIRGKILNKDGSEVFKEDSVDRAKILANYHVKIGEAVVVKVTTKNKSAEYVVNRDGDVLSTITGKPIVQNKDRIVELGMEKFKTLDSKKDKDITNDINPDTHNQAVPPFKLKDTKNDSTLFSPETENTLDKLNIFVNPREICK